MPRGVYFSALRGGNLRSDQGKTMAGIPSFMLKTYEKNKQPGLKPGLAGEQTSPLLCEALALELWYTSNYLNMLSDKRLKYWAHKLTVSKQAILESFHDRSVFPAGYRLSG